MSTPDGGGSGSGPGVGPGFTERRRAVFLDRDGTLMSEREYLADPAGVDLVEGALEALRELRRLDLALVVVTNQSGIARGYYSEDDYRAVAARLEQLLEEGGATVDATYHCPHHPDVTGPCECRKPGTGMYRRAAEELGLELEGSWFVGDKTTDVLPARALGGRGILVRTGYGRDLERELPEGFLVADDVREAAVRIAAHEGAEPGASSP